MAARKKRSIIDVMGANQNTRRLMKQLEESERGPAPPAAPDPAAPVRKKSTRRRAR
jgi:hypothetical protein